MIPSGLFPRIFPAERAGPWGPPRLLLAAAAAAVAAAGQLARQATILPWHTMWAEDGSRFFTNAWLLPFGETVLLDIHGYILVLPRLLAGLSLLAPPEWAAAIFAAAAAAVTGVVAVTIYRAASGHIVRWPLRALLAGLVVLSPVAGAEVLNNLANLQWYLALAAFWMLLWQPSTGPARVWQGAGLGLTALSAPIAVVFTPLAVIRLLVAPRRARELAAPAIFFVGMAVQVVSVLATAPPRGAGFAPVLAAQAYAQRVALVGLVGNENAGQLWQAYAWIGPVVAVMVLAVLIVVAVARGAGSAVPVLLAAGASMVFLALTGSGRGAAWQSAVWETGATHAKISRYLVVPVALVQAIVIKTLDGRPVRVPAGAWRAVTALVVVGLVAGVLGDYTASNPRSEGPLWREELEAARVQCRTVPDLEEVAMQVAPQALDFQARARCDDLFPGSGSGRGIPRRAL